MFVKVCLDTVETTATVMFIVAAASIFGWMLTATGVTAQIAEWVLAVTKQPWLFLLMANLLHFIGDQEGLLRRLAGQIRPGGRLLVVEYEQALPIAWVPFPAPFARLAARVGAAGFGPLAQVGTRRSPSSGRVLYAAAAEPAL